MNEQKHIIWSSDVDYEDWRADLEEQYPDLSEQKRMELMVEQNNDYLDDERCNLNIQLSRPILLIADIGRWDGRYPGYAEIKSGNIRDCLYSEMDDSTWYVDRLGDLRCDAIHHDGTNFYLYRVYKDSASPSQIELLKEKLYRGIATRADITRVTRRLGDDIAKVYGFSIPRQRQAVAWKDEVIKMASLPPVKLDTHEDWFNLLMTVLHQQAEQNPYEEYREMAQKLIDQFMRYGRPFVDSDHAPCVALRMYPKEAGNTIWLLLLSLCNQYDPDKDYSAELKAAKKE